jgi:tRNA threonylcarbamoyladenosine modification (KEOPS) complex Cgi121 subunit
MTENLESLNLRIISNDVRGFTLDILEQLRTILPTVQAVSKDQVLSRDFIIEVGKQTMLSRDRGILLSTKPEIDFLMRLANTTQISKALLVCPKQGDKEYRIIALGSHQEIDRIRKALREPSMNAIVSQAEEDNHIGEKVSHERFRAEKSALLGLGKKSRTYPQVRRP